MGDVVEDRGIRLSISALAAELGVTRETASKRLAQAGVPTDGKRNGYPVYRMGPAVRAIVGGGSDPETTSDPAKMRPTDRRAHFQAESERLAFEEKSGRLVLASEVEFEMSTLVSALTKGLDTLPDRCERDTRCTPEVTEFLIQQVRAMRAEMAAALRADTDEDVRESA